MELSTTSSSSSLRLDKATLVSWRTQLGRKAARLSQEIQRSEKNCGEWNEMVVKLDEEIRALKMQTQMVKRDVKQLENYVDEGAELLTSIREDRRSLRKWSSTWKTEMAVLEINFKKRQCEFDKIAQAHELVMEFIARYK
eukprot:TRINITY_DN7505_c0_g2_i1.p1 TRINITY_DN7505_c0_g2~~TRINITY_DN7505_c0_g2_i1.p1  ORF type:complete len:140 (-),score=29.94 TRINITY_DN7505_c0_g2_i1:201-620(-)